MPFRTLAVLAFAASIVLAGDPPKGPTAEEAKPKVDALKAAKDPDTKKKAIGDAAGCPHATVAATLGAFLADPDEGVRSAAAGALGGMKGSADAARALAAGIGPNAKKPAVLSAVFASMGNVNSAAAVPALKEFAAKQVPIRDEKQSEAVVAAINALGEIKSKASVEVLLDLYKKQVGIGMDCSKGIHGPVYSAITGGLRNHTGQTFNSLPGEAELWWRKHKDEFNDDLTKK